jgi:transposase
MGKRKNRSQHRTGQGSSGNIANWDQGTLQSYRVGALPIINHLLERMHVEEILRKHLPAEAPHTKIAAARGLMLLIKNILLSREPLYGVSDWTHQYAPDLLELSTTQLFAVNDDRAARWLTKFFAWDPPTIALAVTTHCLREFHVNLDELHNDSTTVTFYGDYADAEREYARHGRRAPAITFGHNKDHRPDLKQLLYVLTIAKDGGVPVHFRVHSGNVVDDQTHRETWDLLRQLAGRTDFLYVADCKLATRENMAYIAGHHGRFVSILPRTRKEDAEFREQLAAGRIRWQLLWEKKDDQGQLLDAFSLSDSPALTSEGYRLLWYYSKGKAHLDAATRAANIRRGLQDLGQLRDKLHSPRTRYREQTKIQEAVEGILNTHQVMEFVKVHIEAVPVETFRQNHRGRPGPDTQYTKQVRRRFDLKYEIDHAQLAAAERLDGVFPLVSNDGQLSALELLHAYKRQPLIEKRFEQLKTDFAVAPVWLKKVERIDALLGVYFLALLTEALLERELRQALKREGLDSLPMYPEGRACRCPTVRRLIDVFDPIQRHEICQPGQTPTIAVTELTPLQCRLLQLLRIPVSNYGQ